MRINRPKQSEVKKPVKSAEEPKKETKGKSEFSNTIDLLMKAASSLGEVSSKGDDEKKQFCDEQIANISVIILELKGQSSE